MLQIYRREELWESLKEKSQSSRVDRAAWRWPNETVETSYPEPPEFLAQGDRVLVVGFATGRIKATNRTFEDHWVFDITLRNGKLTNVREYIDTQALARASETTVSPTP
jgi:uncharacterized protein